MTDQKPLKNLDDLNQTDLASAAKDVHVPDLRIPASQPSQTGSSNSHIHTDIYWIMIIQLKTK